MTTTRHTEFERTLCDAYQNVGAFNADILYIYSDLRHFGLYAAGYKDKQDFCQAIASPLLGQGKTIVIATFTYTVDGRYDVLSTPTKIGVMNKWILAQPESSRSEHPLFSYAALGPNAALVENIGKSAFGHDSIYDRLLNKRAAFLHIGRPVSLGNTALHHVEQMCGATYRMHKAFRTEVFKGDNYVGTDYSAFLRRRDVAGQDFEFDFVEAAEKLQHKNLISQVGSEHDLSNISFYWYDQALDYLHDMFYENQHIFIGSDFMEY